MMPQAACVAPARWAFALGMALVAAQCALSAAPATNSQPVEVALPASVFVTNDFSGVDPFYPKSERRVLRSNDPTAKKIGQASGVEALLLKGIMGPPEKRIALINNLTFTKGEEQDVRVPGGKLRITCVDILSKSVIVRIEDQPEQHELVLPEKVLPTPPPE